MEGEKESPGGEGVLSPPLKVKSPSLHSPLSRLLQRGSCPPLRVSVGAGVAPNFGKSGHCPAPCLPDILPTPMYTVPSVHPQLPQSEGHPFPVGQLPHFTDAETKGR